MYNNVHPFKGRCLIPLDPWFVSLYLVCKNEFIGPLLAGIINYYTQLGLTDKDRAIKVLVVCWIYVRCLLGVALNNNPGVRTQMETLLLLVILGCWTWLYSVMGNSLVPLYWYIYSVARLELSYPFQTWYSDSCSS